MSATFSDSTTVIDFYNTYKEANRLMSEYSLERVRTLDILRRYVPAKSVIVDIGGGTGVYSIPLSQQGHTVHLVDLVALHVQQAQEASAHVGVTLASCQVGDARDLHMFPNNFANVVLLFGPLYHLQEASERARTLAEGFRICKSGGILIAAAISWLSSFCDGMKSGFLKDPQFVEIVREDLKSGKHVNKSQHPNYFTDAFFHKPDDLKLEIESAGFVNTRVIAVEGPSWLTMDDNNLEKSPFLDEVFSLLRTIEEEPSMLGVSAHLLGIGTKK